MAARGTHSHPGDPVNTTAGPGAYEEGRPAGHPDTRPPIALGGLTDARAEWPGQAVGSPTDDAGKAKKYRFAWKAEGFAAHPETAREAEILDARMS